jgi:hypothetical protein
MVGQVLPYLDLTYTATNLLKGRVYRFRYRAKNCQGWSTFSDELNVIAAEPPKQPSAAQLDSTLSNTVVLKLSPSSDNMGSVVTDYTIFRNQGNDDEVWTQINGYTYLTHGYIATITTADESMTAGKYY